MPLNARGIISVVQVAVYTPLLFISAFLVIKHGKSRDVGWIYLSFFGIARIVGAILLIAAQQQHPPKQSILTAAFSIQSAGLAPLLMATSGFLGLVVQSSSLESKRRGRILRLASTLGLILSIVGGILTTPTSKHLKTAEKLRKIGSVIFMTVILSLVALQFFFWSRSSEVSSIRRRLLAACSFTLPFLLVRGVYSLASAFTNPFHSEFSLFFGKISIYAGMSVVMELIPVLIFTVVGIALPLSPEKDINGVDMEHYPGSGDHVAIGVQPVHVPMVDEGDRSSKALSSKYVA